MVEPNLRMLVVKDQSDLRRTFVGMLKRMGASAVHGASNDQEAMDLVNHHPVDFIVCEWDAPELNGIALLREVRKKLHHRADPLHLD